MTRLLKWLALFAAALLLIVFVAYTAFVFSPLPRRASIVLDNYFAARDLFLLRARQAGAEIQSYQIRAKGPSGEPLYIDIAWLGSKTPRRALLHISGTHGVEGFAGSAIQSELLRTQLALPEESAAIFVHALNPWGMAHFRRFNESNVDLNRNFVLDSSAFRGVPSEYEKLAWFLNPSGPAAKLDSFPLKAIYALALYGFTTLKQAIAGGQYEFERGIYFGGKQLEESARFFLDWVRSRLSGVKVLFAIEIHTGLGKSAEDTLFWALPISDLRTRLLGQYLGEEFQSDAPDAGVGFRTPGDLQNEVPKVLPDTRIGWTLQEFGAYGPVFTLRALINENRHHFYGGGTLDHWTKRELLEAFSPGSEKWQRRVMERGVRFASGFIPLLDSRIALKDLEGRVRPE